MDKVEVGQVFLRVLPVSINAPHSSLSTRCCYQKDKWAKAGGLPRRQCSFGNRGGGGGGGGSEKRGAKVYFLVWDGGGAGWVGVEKHLTEKYFQLF
jgi:hypothetical protein